MSRNIPPTAAGVTPGAAIADTRIRSAKKIEITVRPSIVGCFDAWLDGQRLCADTPEPLLDGCRALLALGADPRAVVVMRHQDSTTEALRTVVGFGAQYTVKEDGKGVRLVRFSAPPRCPEQPYSPPLVPDD